MFEFNTSETTRRPLESRPDTSVKYLAEQFIKDRMQRMQRTGSLVDERDLKVSPIEDEPWVRWLPMMNNFEAPAWAEYFIALDDVERIQPGAYTFINDMTIHPSTTKPGLGIDAIEFAASIGNLARSLKLQVYALAEIGCEYVYCHTNWESLIGEVNVYTGRPEFHLKFMMYGGRQSPMEWRRKERRYFARR